MPAKLLSSPTKNAIQKTLATQLLSTATTADPITFDDVDGLPNLPGVLVIRRVDTSGAATPAFREYIEYSGTSGNTVLITTRNVDGSNAALTHPVGSIVEFTPDVIWADRVYDALSSIVDVNDISVINSSLVTLTGTQSISGKTFSDAITVAQIATPANPSAGRNKIYTKTGDKVYSLTSAGVESIIATEAYVSAASGGSLADEDNSGNSSTNSSTFANITGADVSVVLTKTSNVLLLASVQAYGNVDLAPYAIQWHDGTSVIGGPMQISLRSSNPRTTVVCNTVVVSATAGTKTYTLQHRSTDNTSSLTAEAVNTLAISIPSA